MTVSARSAPTRSTVRRTGGQRPSASRSEKKAARRLAGSALAGRAALRARSSGCRRYRKVEGSSVPTSGRRWCIAAVGRASSGSESHRVPSGKWRTVTCPAPGSRATACRSARRRAEKARSSLPPFGASSSPAVTATSRTQALDAACDRSDPETFRADALCPSRGDPCSGRQYTDEASSDFCDGQAFRASCAWAGGTLCECWTGRVQGLCASAVRGGVVHWLERPGVSSFRGVRTPLIAGLAVAVDSGQSHPALAHRRSFVMTGLVTLDEHVHAHSRLRCSTGEDASFAGGGAQQTGERTWTEGADERASAPVSSRRRTPIHRT